MRRALVAVALTSGLALAATPARADENAIGLSRDGTQWSGSLDGPLFDPAIRWVPGDVRTTRFFVRNQHPDRGDLVVDLERVRRDQLLDTGWLHVSARAGARPWTTVSAGGLQELLDTDDLVSGDPVPVEVRVRMDRQAPNGTMVLSTDLDLRITLVDARAGDEGDEGDGDGSQPGGGDLPDTGAPVTPWMLPLAAGLLGVGSALVVRRRREDEHDAHDAHDPRDAVG